MKIADGAALVALWTLGCGRIGFDLLPLPLDGGAVASDGATRGASPLDGGPPFVAVAARRDGTVTDAATSAIDATPVLLPRDAGSADAALPFATDAALALDGSGVPPADSGAPVLLADSFDGSALGSWWTQVNADDMTASVAGGALHLTPLLTGLWYANTESGALVTPVAGDFVATADVAATGPGFSTLLGPGIEMAGVIVLGSLEPTAPKSHVWAAIGAVDGVPSRESKSTVAGYSTYVADPYGAERALVRVCRIGATFRTYHRLSSSTAWDSHQIYDRPDLPSAVHVGVFASEGSDPVDLQADVTSVTIRRVRSVADCTGG